MSAVDFAVQGGAAIVLLFPVVSAVAVMAVGLLRR